jgi:hypothetical protein
VFDHQVDIERELRLLADNFDNHRSEGNVVDEMAIHDVAVNPVGAGRFYLSDFVGQLGKVGREDGRSDDDFLH